MNKIERCLFGFVFGMGLIQGNLLADIVRGEVTGINKEHQSITILQKDSSGLVQRNKEFTLRPDAQFAGIQSLEDLEVGDEVQAEVNKKMFRNDEVKLLAATETKIANKARAIKRTVKNPASKTGGPVSLYVPKRTSFAPRTVALPGTSDLSRTLSGKKGEAVS
ncbi:MAG TPA: hypothetical protein VJC08_00275 [bacterium]|nr:hypothetical protein [bacterium]